jgi:hypothetical protein
MVGADHLAFQRLALRFAAALALGAAGLTGGCAVSSTYMGLNLTAPDLPVELRELARRAQAGDKQAQLELGIAFEEGRGVVRNIKLASQLYGAAASDTGGKRTMYVPTGTGSVQAVTVDTGLLVPGLFEAKRRLSATRAETFR